MALMREARLCANFKRITIFNSNLHAHTGHHLESPVSKQGKNHECVDILGIIYLDSHPKVLKFPNHPVLLP